MALYYGRHKVKDYESWRPHFDGDQKSIEAVGAKTLSIMRSADDPNNVHFIFDIPDLGAWMEMMQSPRLQTLMQTAGVLEAPDFYLMQELKP